MRFIIFIHSFHFLISFIQLWRAHHHPQSARSLELRLSIFVQGLFWILRDVMCLFIFYISLSLLVVGQFFLSSGIQRMSSDYFMYVIFNSIANDVDCLFRCLHVSVQCITSICIKFATKFNNQYNLQKPIKPSK